MSSILKSKKSRWTTILTAAFLVACLAPDGAEARKGRKGKGKRPAAAAKINVSALGELMGVFKFGMSKDKVLKTLGKQLSGRYKTKIRETSDIATQDALRREQAKEVKKIRASYAAFKGIKTGWDVSIIDDQFGHKSSESMLVYWEQNENGNNQRRFFFFHRGSLYKMFIVLDSKILPRDQRNFGFFKNLMATRYGDGKLVTKTLRSGETIPTLVDWSTSSLHVQAIDKISFYGSFALMIADPNVEAMVMSDRDAVRVTKKGNTIINSMVERDTDLPPSLDSNSSVIDSALK